MGASTFVEQLGRPWRRSRCPSAWRQWPASCANSGTKPSTDVVAAAQRAHVRELLGTMSVSVGGGVSARHRHRRGQLAGGGETRAHRLGRCEDDARWRSVDFRAAEAPGIHKDRSIHHRGGVGRAFAPGACNGGQIGRFGSCCHRIGVAPSIGGHLSNLGRHLRNKPRWRRSRFERRPIAEVCLPASAEKRLQVDEETGGAAHPANCRHHRRCTGQKFATIASAIPMNPEVGETDMPPVVVWVKGAILVSHKSRLEDWAGDR